MTRTIVILGASFAGLIVAHKLLKQTLPAVKDLKVVLVAPSTHIYGNLASVRAIIPGQISDEKLWVDIMPGFKKYPAERFQFILGTATLVDPQTKSVLISTASGEIKQTYHTLVVTTGSRAEAGVPWKNAGSYESGKETLHKIQEKVKAAKSIVVGGAGPTGVETAGELGYEYGERKEKQITLVTSGPEILVGGLPTPQAQAAQKTLEALNVKIIKNTRILNSTSSSDGRTELRLENGEKLITDLYLPTIGVIPNTEFLPSKLLNKKNELVTDNHLRVRDAPDIWAAGDVTDLQRSHIFIAEAQAKALAKNLDLVLKGREPLRYKSDAPDMLAVTLGRGKGTGIAGSFKLPSMVVWWVKGRKLGTDKLHGYVTGAAI